MVQFHCSDLFANFSHKKQQINMNNKIVSHLDLGNLILKGIL